jgi:hypothetical protein
MVGKQFLNISHETNEDSIGNSPKSITDLLKSIQRIDYQQLLENPQRAANFGIFVTIKKKSQSLQFKRLF